MKILLMNRLTRRLVSKIPLFFFLICFSCQFSTEQAPQAVQTSGLYFQSIETGKACYQPGETLYFQLKAKQPIIQGKLLVRYLHLDKLIKTRTIETANKKQFHWSWLPPEQDYQGYLVEVYLISGQITLDQINIAVDVSSDWQKFPRYGFISKFPELPDSAIHSVIRRLNRHHINGLQFYDWHYKHHSPLAGSPENPAKTWPDIARRENHFSTIENYIHAAHNCNMRTMAYNLLYGSWEDGPREGVSLYWRLYRDRQGKKPVKIDFDANWSSDIYWMNPANRGWQKYINEKTADVFKALPFDGWHVDQLGDWGQMWTADGKAVSVDTTFQPFLESAAAYLQRPLVMNAVLQYGQAGIAKSPVGFLYSEVWDPDSTFNDLVHIIRQNDSLSNGKLATVLAAYVNQGIAENPGMLNTPAVLLSNAAILAAGGSHLELGEHYLVHPYFPNSNLKQAQKLQQKLITYYDFQVAYQNLLRDGILPFKGNLSSADQSLSYSGTAQRGSLWYLTRQKNKRKIIHLINLKSAVTLNWRDNEGIQKEPENLHNLDLEIDWTGPVEKIWWASPDYRQGTAQPLSFQKDKNALRLTLPELAYWSMIVVER